jgi:hypothetical protein
MMLGTHLGCMVIGYHWTNKLYGDPAMFCATLLSATLPICPRELALVMSAIVISCPACNTLAPSTHHNVLVHLPAPII